MATIVLYELSADPYGVANVTVTDAYTVTITDTDGVLEASDTGATPQLDLSGTGVSINTTNFETFESYSGFVGGAPVSFTLVQFSGTPYMILNSGSVSVGQTITGTNNAPGPTSGPETDYTVLPDFACFMSGTRIETPGGTVEIQDIQTGDLVVLANGDVKRVLWIGRRKLSREELRSAPHLRPIRFKPGSMGPGCPARDVWVSPQHRVAVTATGLELMADTHVMLASAKSLVNGRDVVQRQGFRPVEYFHILFDQHEILNVDGLMCETFFPGETTVDALSEATRTELYELFPELEDDLHNYGDTALPVLKPYEASVILSDVRTASKSDFAQMVLH